MLLVHLYKEKANSRVHKSITADADNSERKRFEPCVVPPTIVMIKAVNNVGISRVPERVPKTNPVWEYKLYPKVLYLNL